MVYICNLSDVLFTGYELKLSALLCAWELIMLITNIF